jgi:endonuclease-3
MIAHINNIIALLKKTYPLHAFTQVNGSDPYRILISCILSLRTQDAVSLPATQRLFKQAPNLAAMSKLKATEIAKLIYPVGFYRNKAKSIATINHQLLSEHHGIVPNTLEGLTAFKGVGRKTANLVLSLGFNIPAICVDIHVHRISNRLGWVNSKTPEESEQQLMKYFLSITFY